MLTSIRILRSSIELKASLALAVAAIAFVPSTLTAAVSTLGFTDGTGTTSFDQYTGSTGGGWDTTWATSGTASTVSVINTNPISGGGNYLSVGNTNTTGDAPIFRSFDGAASGQLITSPYRVSYSLRVDTLGNFNNTNDYISLSDNTTTGGAGTNSTFLIRAYGATTGTATGGVWAFHNGTQNGTFSTNLFQSSTMAVTAGVTYSFTIDVNPLTRTYDVSIYDGSTTVSATGLGFRKSANTGADYLNFTTKNDVASASDSIIYSLDNIAVGAIPEPSTYAAILGLGVLGFTALRRRPSNR
jgi:hypothetical protein